MDSTPRNPTGSMANAADQAPRTLVVGIDVRCLTDPYLRGFSRYTVRLIETLSRRPDVNVIAFTDADLVHEVRVPVVRFAARREIIREQVALPRVIREHGVDFFLCPTNRGLPLVAPCPTVLTLHDAVEWDAALVDPRRGRSRLRFAYASAFSLAGASLIITVSRASADAIRAAVGVSEDRLRVVHEAADARFTPTADVRDASILQRLGISGDYVLYVGGFDKKKDVPTLVRAFAEAAADGVSLVLAGRITDEAASILQLADDLGIGEHVHMPGYVGDLDLPALYRSARCFVFPAIAEGFGLPVVEAMACGVPILAADAASLPEILAEGGRLFAAADVAGLAVLLRDLLSSDHARQQWSIAARSRAAGFSWDATAAQTEAVLREAAATTRRNVVMSRLRRLLQARNWAS
ncbi:unannotated protein [freshwater metagenome]|uniref:Unannotated protein n=1 Tax=freshwater metagenome TaxID=449393 RepID=A0A6J7EY77_9ZZZZ